eukprot:364050-Chlamydomonas_euryale.AAC.23
MSGGQVSTSGRHITTRAWAPRRVQQAGNSSMRPGSSATHQHNHVPRLALARAALVLRQHDHCPQSRKPSCLAVFECRGKLSTGAYMKYTTPHAMQRPYLPRS